MGVLPRQWLQFDFGVAHTKQEWEAGTVADNFGAQDLRPASGEEGSLDAFSESIVGTDWQTYRREGPGMSAFAVEDGPVSLHLLDVRAGAGQPVGHVPVA